MLLTFREKHHEIADVWSFIFDPPEPLEWKPGQSMRFELPHKNEDKKGKERWFTIASSPFEKYIQVTTRVTDTSYKQALANMKAGDEITADELEGTFVWPETEDPVVFVAAGIGITPYHSMLNERQYNSEHIPVTLIYGNRTKEIVFKERLDRWAAAHPELKIFYKVGVRLTAENLREIIPDIESHLVYLSGPEPMVIDLSQQLRKSGVKRKQIITDEFPGYDESNY